MSGVKRTMALTEELAAQAARPVPDTGPNPGAVYMTEEDYERVIEQFMSHSGGDLWVFGYGSLLWKPAFEATERQRAVVPGWHRAFRFRVARFRGTRECPGLMMGLDRGGQCEGIVLRMPKDRIKEDLGVLLRREMVTVDTPNVPRWLKAHTPGGPVRAIGFVINPKSPHYAGRLNLEEVADAVVVAAGHWGSCADYLRQTVAHLEEIGVHDENLWRLQELVAQRIHQRLAVEQWS